MKTAKKILIATAMMSAGSAAMAGEKPNIVYSLVDQWRAQTTGYSGDPNVKTPHLDRLAKEALNFRNTVSVCPVCTPHRAALMTGRFPMTTGMFLNDRPLPSGELCLAEIFRDAGYDTAYIGKWHLDGHGREAFIPRERRQGWDYWKVAECDHTYNHSHYYAGNSEEKKFWEGYDAYAQTRDAQAYLRDQARKDKPFVLMLSYGPPHFPHGTAPEDMKALYPPETLKLSPNVTGDQAQVRKELQGYLAHCTALDRCIGDVVKTLAETGLDKNTIVVFTSDHGEMMGSHGIKPRTKQVAYDEAARVPFLLKVPGQLTAREVHAPITTPDILPTLLGLTGVAIPKTIEGEDLSGIVRGGAEQDRVALYMSVIPFAGVPFLPYRAIRTATHSLIRQQGGPPLLFDDVKDPFQLHNLADDEGNAALRKNLEARLDAELKRINDDFPAPEEARRRWNILQSPKKSHSGKKEK